MRRVLAVLCVAMVAGCSGREVKLERGPQNDLMPKGSAAVVGPEKASLEVAKFEEWSTLEPGTKVTVRDDPGFHEFSDEEVEKLVQMYQDEAKMPGSKTTPERLHDAITKTRRNMPGRHEPPDAMAKMRQVSVVVASGEHKGKTGTVVRYRIRPAD